MSVTGSKLMRGYSAKGRSRVDTALSTYLDDIKHAAKYGKNNLDGLFYNYSDAEVRDLKMRLNILGYSCTYSKNKDITKMAVSWYA